MGLCPSTGRPSQACANTSGKARGIQCEELVAQAFQQRGYQVFKRNHRVCGIEIDLILKKQHWLILEVKSLSRLENIPFRLSVKQRKRLETARALFSDNVAEAVEFLVVYVGADGEFIELALEDHQ